MAAAGLLDLPFSTFLGGAGEADCLLNLLGDKDRVLDLSNNLINPGQDIITTITTHLSTVGGLEATEAGLDLWRGWPMASLCLALLANVVPVGPEDLDLG